MHLCNGMHPGVVECTCNLATLDAEFWNDVGSIPVGANSPVIQHKEKGLIKYWNLTDT